MMTSSKKKFVKLIQANQGLINSLCRIYGRESEFEDLRQDVLLQLWRAYPTFRAESKVSTWIYRVGLNTILAKRRKAGKNLKCEPISEEHGESRPVMPLFDDGVEQLYCAINQLSDLNKAIAILNLEGYSHVEIAGLLDLTPTNVSTRFGRIKTKLRKIFKSACHEIR